MLSEAEIIEARTVSWHLRAEAVSLLKSTAVWEAAQGVLPLSKTKLPHALAITKQQIQLACMRDVMLGLWRVCDSKQDFISIYRLQRIINELGKEDYRVVAAKLWSAKS
jgi:hypothetical protein